MMVWTSRVETANWSIAYPRMLTKTLLTEAKTSPGNAFSPHKMRMPHLDFIYRIVAEMDQGGVTPIEGVDGTDKIRLVLPIEGGTVHGPGIKGVIVHKSGADWAEVMNPKKVIISNSDNSE